MTGKIALEEHFATTDTILDSKPFVPSALWPELKARLEDLQDGRLRAMDAAGIDVMIVSLNSPGVQSVRNAQRALDVARRANDWLANAIQLRPDRLQGLAALPLQDPDLAARELERGVTQLGLCGALVNGFSETERHSAGLYYDGPEFRDFWSVVEGLDVPFYLHPRNPLASDATIYRGHEWLLGPTWAFAQETAVHALRLMGSGLFDERPRLKIILGHLGEGLPFNLWRIDHRNAWMKTPPAHRARRPIGAIFRENFYVTTSGNFSASALFDAMLELGSDHILFSADWPFEDTIDAAKWFDNVAISDNDRRKIGRTNALSLFRLGSRRIA